MAKAYQAVLFDMDGTLFDTERMSFEAWEEVERVYGVHVPGELILRFTGSAVPRAAEILREGLAGQVDGPGQPTVDQMMSEHGRAWRKMRASQPVPLKGDDLPGLLTALKSRGLKLAVASSSQRPFVEENLRRAGIFSYFDALVGGGDIANGKPAPDIYLAAAKKLKCAPEACLVVEDSVTGATSGRAAGMDVAFIPDLVPADDYVTSECTVLEKIDQVANLIG